MFERIEAANPADLLLPMARRPRRGVYFARLCAWDDALREGVWAFHEAARQRGVVLDGGLQNPDSAQLAYLFEALGQDFAPDAEFLEGRLEKWMPRLSGAGRKELAGGMLKLFEALRYQGKTESAQRNLYFKLMCWLYYRFERLMPLLDGGEPPRVLLCEPEITAHELLMLRLLNGLGADLLLLEPRGDAAYLKQDPNSAHSQRLGGERPPFPEGFTLKQLRREMATPPAPASPAPTPAQGRPAPSGPRLTLEPAADRTPRGPRLTLEPTDPAPRPRPRLTLGNEPAPAPAPESAPAALPLTGPLSRFTPPEQAPCTNAWMKEATLEVLLTPIARRGSDPKRFYNAFLRVRGVPDRERYVPDLRQFARRMEATGRRLFILDDGLSMPSPQEVAAIRRGNYPDAESMIAGLAANLPASASTQLERLMRASFALTLLEARADQPSLRRLLNAAVYLLCWIKRYQGRLFTGYRDGDVPCFVLMGGCRSGEDSLYPKYLSRLPVDVLILAPDLNRPCALRDERLAEQAGEGSLPLTRFPAGGELRMDTAASQARDELDGLLYDDSGLYREGQFARGDALTLRTTADELFMLWGEDLKYRSGFAAAEGVVTMPVLYAKLSGVEGGRPDAWWQKLAGLLEGGDCLSWRLPGPDEGPNPFQSLALRALRDRKLDVAALRRDPKYPFALLREPLQRHMLDKLRLLLERRLVRGTFENGTEYTVVATVLNLDREVLRLLQSFDFTGRNPKLVCACAGEQGPSLEDAIRVAYLNLVGFDIALVVPTGYQTVERYLREGWPVEHRVGPFMYDLPIPRLETLPRPRRGWLGGLLGRRG